MVPASRLICDLEHAQFREHVGAFDNQPFAVDHRLKAR
jgi:hypothetical protein